MRCSNSLHIERSAQYAVGQRITTLYQYFKGSEDLKLEKGIEPYSKLKEDEPRLLQFLEYEVVVRDLGQVSRDEIIEVFRRINSTKYSLNAVEVQNARFEGEFKAFSEWLSEHRFFEEHRVFTAKSAKRMGDLRFAMTLVIAMLSTYFNRDDELESYLEQYNDEFPHAESIGSRIEDVFRAVDGVNFGNASRAWNEVNLLTILVEVDRFLQLHGRELDAATSSRLHDFFEDLEKFGSQDPSTSHLGRYYAAQRYATADRSNRVRRGEILRDILEGIGPEVWRLPRAEHEQ